MLVPNGKKLELFEVNLWTGRFVPVKTDLYVADTIPLAFTRTFSPIDDWIKRNRLFLRHVYEPNLFGDRVPYTYLEWQLPDNIQEHYRRISPGTGYSDAVYEHPDDPTIFAGSRVNWNGYGWDLSLEDGTTYLSPEAYNATRPQQASLVAIFDENGNEVRLSRKSNGDLTEIKSPGGQWIRLTYDEGRITQAKDSLGNVVEYQYDSEDRLQTVRYPSGRRTNYIYDGSNRVIEVQDPPGISVVKNLYDSNGRVIQQTLPDGKSYLFQYGPQKNGMNLWVEITSPSSEITRINLFGKSYTMEKEWTTHR